MSLIGSFGDQGTPTARDPYEPGDLSSGNERCSSFTGAVTNPCDTLMVLALCIVGKRLLSQVW